MSKGTLFLALSVTGCVGRDVTERPANAPIQREAPVRFFPPPFDLRDPEDAVLRLLAPEAACSGTLIEADLLLTAHHCVVRHGPGGEYTSKLASAEDLRVEIGGDYLAWGTVGVRAIVAPPCGEQGGLGDVAVLVLERKLTGLATMTPRLSGPPKIGEILDPAGFGRCGLSPDGIHRTVRFGGSVDWYVPGVFHMQASVCPGDSGGPVFTRATHELVGVISLSAMDADDRTRAPSLMARIDSFRPVFSQARMIADGVSAADLPPLSCD